MGHQDDVSVIKGLFKGKKLLTVRFKDWKYDYGTELGSKWKQVDPLPYDQYNAIYNDFHVSIAPLKDNDFNNCKSNLKAVEAGFKKRAFIGSDIPLYQSVIKSGVNGILCKTKDDWRKAISYMTVDMAKELGEALYDTVSSDYNIHDINATRINSLK
jgi:glycosyltransferase involved in cell wall biosynthesis